jgi:hypothetical protein
MENIQEQNQRSIYFKVYVTQLLVGYEKTESNKEDLNCIFEELNIPHFSLSPDAIRQARLNNLSQSNSIKLPNLENNERRLIN